MSKNGVKRLSIGFQQNEVLSCTVTDNGIGRKASEAINKKRRDKHASFATGAIEKRFALLRGYYKLDLGFTYTNLEENGKPSGTEVIIKTPYLKDDA